MLCRDFLQHLPNAMAALALKNFIASEIPWLLATSHSNEQNADIPRQGMFRPLNLTAEPFNLAPTRKSVADGAGRILGLWHRSEMTTPY